MTAPNAARPLGESSVETPVMPGRNGGALRRGGGNPKRNGGRPPNVVREGFRESLPAEVRKLEAHARAIEALGDPERSFKARLQLAEFKAKYGLGTTFTETDAEGRAVTVRVIRDARRADDN